VGKVIENLLGGFINGLINDFLLEKLPGYFLCQLDTKGAMGTNSIYLP
jgi:hypothetical protein